MSVESKVSRGWRKSTLPLRVVLLRVAKDQEGATAIEYALLAAGIGAAVAATVWSLGATTNALYSSVEKLL